MGNVTYNVILKFGYYEQMVIENVDTIDLTIIIPIVTKMKYFEHDVEKAVHVEIERVEREEVVKEDGGIEECL